MSAKRTLSPRLGASATRKSPSASPSASPTRRTCPKVVAQVFDDGSDPPRIENNFDPCSGTLSDAKQKQYKPNSESEPGPSALLQIPLSPRKLRSSSRSPSPASSIASDDSTYVERCSARTESRRGGRKKLEPIPLAEYASEEEMTETIEKLEERFALRIQNPIFKTIYKDQMPVPTEPELLLRIDWGKILSMKGSIFFCACCHMKGTGRDKIVCHVYAHYGGTINCPDSECSQVFNCEKTLRTHLTKKHNWEHTKKCK